MDWPRGQILTCGLRQWPQFLVGRRNGGGGLVAGALGAGDLVRGDRVTGVETGGDEGEEHGAAGERDAQREEGGVGLRGLMCGLPTDEVEHDDGAEEGAGEGELGRRA